jgi:hypothetical protein
MDVSDENGYNRKLPISALGPYAGWLTLHRMTSRPESQS